MSRNRKITWIMLPLIERRRSMVDHNRILVDPQTKVMIELVGEIRDLKKKQDHQLDLSAQMVNILAQILEQLEAAPKKP